MDDASRAQVGAASPSTSTWLSANAGSGKTRVLTDRVARLLLEGVPPERILCLTYTKAAAMEMQNRLFDRLGAWAMKSDTELNEALAQVGVDVAPDPELLGRARTLFARAVEAPGGLKIQTIHSFCASVLRRFPLEAAIAPGFTEIDEAAQIRVMAEILDDIAADPAGQAALDQVAAFLSDEDGILQIAARVAGEAEALRQPWDWAAICNWALIAPELTEADIIETALDGGEAALVGDILPHLDLSKSTHASLAERLGAMPWQAMTLDSLRDLEAACLTQSGSAPFSAKQIANADVRSAMGADLVARYDALAARVEAASRLRRGLMTARRTRALHGFAEVFLQSYDAAKEQRGYLDFDDLIARTRALLTAREVAQWVLFRLDGGIDHILVDEAQDTSPEQWLIVDQLTADFAAGEGARADVERTIFVVGDKKQSIYSFQGADPDGFDRMRAHFADRLERIGAPFQDRELIWSFRSAPTILSLVDRVAAGAGAAGVGPEVRHHAFFEARPGRVDLWPLVPAAPKSDPPDWQDPRDLTGQDHHVTLLARALAGRIAAMIDEGVPLVTEGLRRPVEAGDILILVQSRSPLFRAIISELKSQGLPVAGIDRSQIADPLAVQDLLALLRFLATPEDDLSLACVLRSPLGGWDEAELFDLAHDRGEAYLWQALRGRAAAWPETVAMLRDLRDHADLLRPYDLLERILIRHDGRRKLVARLGPEAEDAIDAVLAQALSFEQLEVPSLTGFVGWLETGKVVVKRDLAQARGQIRVMTVHGAKGLEAPVVILPDTAMRGGGRRGHALLQPEGGGPLLWGGPATDALPEELAAKQARNAADAAERNRLLYVAMTRAESWLIVAAAGGIGKTPEKSWYHTIREAMEAEGAAPLSIPEIGEGGLRLQQGDWAPLGRTGSVGRTPVALPAWVNQYAPAAARDAGALTPTGLGGAKALPGEHGASDEAQALRRGRLVHLLLEHLPHLPEPAWPAAAPGIAALEASDVTSAELAPLLSEATTVLTSPALREVFDPAALAEVELVAPSTVLGAPVTGVIDRLVIGPDRILAVDFKTNAVVPATPGSVPEGLLRQMGAYAEMLGAIYPGRRVDVAILWSRTAKLMLLPPKLVREALERVRSA